MWFDLRRCDPLPEGPPLLRRELRLRAPPPVVFALLVDPHELSRWVPGLRHASWLTAAPHGVGSLRRRDLGTVRLVEHVAVWSPGRRLATWVERATLPFARHVLEDLRLEEADGETRLTWTIHLSLRRPFRPAARPLAAVLRREHERAVRNLAVLAAVRWAETAAPAPVDNSGGISAP